MKRVEWLWLGQSGTANRLERLRQMVAGFEQSHEGTSVDTSAGISIDWKEKVAGIYFVSPQLLLLGLFYVSLE